MSALAGVGLHEKLAGNFLLAIDLRRTGEERTVGAVATRLNRLQFLTIRSYLTLVFCTLIALLVVVALWR